jgi:hypothetical protein
MGIADVVPGDWQDHRRARCWVCGFMGRSTSVRARAQAEADAHVCPPEALVAFRRRVEAKIAVEAQQEARAVQGSLL